MGHVAEVAILPIRAADALEAVEGARRATQGMVRTAVRRHRSVGPQVLAGLGRGGVAAATTRAAPAEAVAAQVVAVGSLLPRDALRNSPARTLR